jgi:YidC/Oxa1 family membrane protein insertase
MERNNIIGITLIFILFFVWSYINSPSKAELERVQFVQDSLAQVEKAIREAKVTDASTTASAAPQEEEVILPDSIRLLNLANKFGAFAPSANGAEALNTLENDLFKVTFTNKGGRIKNVEVKGYKKLVDEKKENGETVELSSTVRLLEDEANRFEYQLPLSNGQTISTQDLFFDAAVNGNTITFRANTNTGGYFEVRHQPR